MNDGLLPLHYSLTPLLPPVEQHRRGTQTLSPVRLIGTRLYRRPADQRGYRCFPARPEQVAVSAGPAAAQGVGRCQADAPRTFAHTRLAMLTSCAAQERIIRQPIVQLRRFSSPTMPPGRPADLPDVFSALGRTTLASAWLPPPLGSCGCAPARSKNRPVFAMPARGCRLGRRNPTGKIAFNLKPCPKLLTFRPSAPSHPA